jgi:hydroxypyruvate isomerase
MRFEPAANISLLFSELPYLDRFAAAADAGFTSVETWWPFATAVPEERELADFLSAASVIPLSAINLFAGDVGAGERGLACRLDRRGDFVANLTAVTRIAEHTGCTGFNALYGQFQPGHSIEAQRAVAITNLSLATTRLSALGGTVFVEPLTRGISGRYPVQTAADAASIVREVRETTGLPNIGILFDTFHLANNGVDLVWAIRTWRALIARVQLADCPSRSEPGSGRLDFPAIIEELSTAGYRGVIAGEYVPSAPSTLNTLGWMNLLQ